MNWNSWLRSPNAFFWFVCALGLVLRLIGFLDVDLWQDEANEVFLSEGSFVEVWDRLRSSEMRPPIRYFFLNLWLHGGRGTEYLRLPSLLFSTLSVGVLYLGARRLLREDVARWGAVLMAVASFPISSAHFCRSYAMDLFVCVLAFHAFARVATATRWSERVYFVMAVTLAIYTSYFAALVCVSMAFVHGLAVCRGNLSSRSFVALYAPIAVLSAPLLPLVFEQWSNAETHRWHAGGSSWLVAELYFNALGAGRIKDWTVSPQQFWLALSCIALAALGSWEIAKRDSSVASAPAGRIVPLWFFAPTAGLFIVSQVSIGLFTIRTMLVYAPAYYLLIAAGLSRIGRPMVTGSFAALFAAINLYAFHTTHDLRHITNGSQQIARHIESSAQAGEKVIHAQHFTYFPMRLYAPTLDHLIWQPAVPWNWGGAQVPREHLSWQFGAIRKLDGFWFVRKRDHYHEQRTRWLEQLRTITSPWQGPDGLRHRFEADSRILGDGVVLVHYKRIEDPGQQQRGAYHLRLELERQLDDRIYRSVADAAWLEQALKSLPVTNPRD